ncbi:BnaC02g30160D [Brassica napus]|uniref:BnaC02g30160D protein n=1 Tax=Brassica napus TaxID=3708 RepID=A0A078GFI5_BRANA|nr:BnaC02g30160D [Brassica napus]
MDSPVSRSDSSSEPGEGSNCDLMAPLPLSYVNAAPPLVGPASSVGEDELAEWRGRYSLPYSVILRVPTREERASSYIPGEISVYEAFFDSSLRGTIPALIVGLCNLFEISPSKLNPPAWRILIATENLGDLEYLSLGINEFLFAYHLAPLNGGEGRFHLRPRSGLPIVEELRKSDWKGLVFNKKWQERYAFMMFPGSSYRWNFIGERAVLRARKLHVDRRQVNFLVSETVLRRSSLWSKRPLALSSFLF